MTARAAESVGIASSWLTADVDPIGRPDSRFLLAPQGAWRLGLGRHRSDNYVVALLQVPFENCVDLSIGMVCDSKRNLDRFHCVIWMELPNHGRLCLRCAR